MIAMRRSVLVGGFVIVALAAPIATVASLTGNVVAVVGAVAGWAALIAYWWYTPQLWSDVDARRARAAALGGWVLALVAFALGLVGNYAVSINSGLCGGGAAPVVAFSVAAALYVVAGTVGLRPASRLLWLWPLLVLGGWAVFLAVRAALPGGHGFCET